MRLNKPDIKNAFMAAFPHTLPVLTGFSVLGIAYGVLMQTKGYGAGWSVLFSAAAFCGSMQFAAITILTSVFNPIQAFIMSVMVNARHIFYGISMLEKYKGLGKIKHFLIYTLCDETFSITCSVQPPNGINRKYFYLFVSLLDYIYWVSGTFIGGVLGGIITFNTKGLDFVLTALFVVLFAEQIKQRENKWPALIGITGAVGSLLVFGRDNMVIPAMVIILIVLAGGQRKLCR